MKIIVADTYEALSKKAADDLVVLTRSIKEPLVCTASGDSPSGLYKELVYKVSEKHPDISSWYFVGLDEWTGMNGKDEGSCRFYLDRQFFHPLAVREERICFFDGRAADAQAECQRTENFIEKHQGIDVAILGLGMNGHVGMNEPGTPPDLRSHLADIDPQTQAVGQKYFTQQKDISHGLTLGIATLNEAKQIMLLVSGAHKAAIVKRVVEEEASEQLPASLLRDHPGFTLYLDQAAAQFLDNSSQLSGKTVRP